MKPRGLTRGDRQSPKRPLIGLAATTLAAAVAAGCLGSGYTYINHRNPDSTNVYFKVPSQWTLYGQKQVLEAQNGPLGPSALKQLSNGLWEEALSASPTSASNALKIGARFPTGIVVAHQLSPSERDQLTFSTMRAELLGADPLTAPSGFQVISYDEFTGTGGVRGSRLVVNIDNRGSVRTFGQVVAVDAQTNWIFAIGVGCKISCYSANSGLIHQVLSSWTVKEARA